MLMLTIETLAVGTMLVLIARVVLWFLIRLLVFAVVGSLAVAIVSTAHLDGLNKTRTPDGLPVFEVSASRTPAIAKHVTRALAQHPEWTLLHRNAFYPPLTSLNRSDACRAWKSPLSCDEMPMASTFEGGGPDVSVAGVPFREQQIQGGDLAAFYRRHAVGDGGAFLVRVVA